CAAHAQSRARRARFGSLPREARQASGSVPKKCPMKAKLAEQNTRSQRGNEEEEEEEEEEGLGHWAKALRHTGEHSERFLDRGSLASRGLPRILRRNLEKPVDGTSSPNWRSVPIEHRRGDTGHGIATAAARCRTKLTPFGGTK
ncbi:unnamed protein product, partial [Prorocentrum cordatum]